ncbi:hypothetical protein [Kaistella jeonii]|uniref:hypothetical protein n=2 Tax=Kaistella jeonii TaxID=266749 RepID=UPI0006906880|nr:hypothetical protein [Kaistella jeonii]SFB69683.1 hypothetical protein SAMN05421876_101161 [Kaistella jeonii]VEI94760.1 Uncharacterised protein [Kaistella jeonii]
MKIPMFKFTFLILLFGSVSLFFAKENIPYRLAQNYFVRNDFPDHKFQIIKITNNKQLVGIFGMAAAMGKNGTPTEIDFSKNFAIAVINGVSNNVDALNIKSLIHKKNSLKINYSLIKTEVKSFSSRHFNLLIVDKKYVNNKLYANCKSATETIIIGKEIYENSYKSSIASIYSILNNNCISWVEIHSVFKRKAGNFGLVFNKNYFEV